jgi:four helix bundle protein
MTVQSFADLEVWQMAMTLAEDCYRLTAHFPNSELYGLTSQIRRASVSVPSNIAEGHGRETTRSFIHFSRVAQGSLKELQTQLLLAGRVGLTTSTATQPLIEKCDRIGKMLRSMIRSLERKIDGPPLEEFP